jgi:YidC/Oxa1 family membrane protein insertase
MNPNNQKPSFLDRGTIIAFVIIMVFWVLWANFMEKKTPSPQANAPVASSPTPGATPSLTAQAPAAGEAAALSAAASQNETFTDFSDDKWSFQISSKGMGLRNIDIKAYTDRENRPVVLGEVSGPHPFATELLENGQPIDFAIEKTASDTFVGRANVGGVQIEKTMKVDPATYSIATEINAVGPAGQFKGFATNLSDKLAEVHQSGFLSGGSYERQDWFVAHDDTKTRQVLSKEKGNALDAQNVTVAALSSHYFALAIVDNSPLLPSFESKMAPQAMVATGRLVYKPVNPVDNFAVKYTAFAGPKSFDILSKVDEKLTNVIDYGTFAVIAKPILRLLKFLHSILGNWGWSIILLTILVRMLVLPFNIYSFRSMKVMQKIQPEMTRIREKYKDATPDKKMQMNQEIMELMKAHKANPLGGCLPMLLQLPVFFALYQVLGQSIELYKAPFMLWITDLSAKDPYFVLPVLMGITMFVQQKITPTTMDPQQAKIMMWMPVIFSVFMVSLPSGLTLYIFVSTLFGIIQQFVFMRDRTPAASVKPAKA